MDYGCFIYTSSNILCNVADKFVNLNKTNQKIRYKYGQLKKLTTRQK